MNIQRIAALFCFIRLLHAPCLAAEEPYPRIQSLSHDDPLYRQVSYDIEAFYRYEKQGEGYLPPFSLYRYRTETGETLFDIASRMNLPYETIALLNGFEHPADLDGGTMLYIPNQPGLFLSLRSENELSRIMAGWREVSEATRFTLDAGEGSREYYFLPGERLHPVERAYFLGILFRIPLSQGVITSGFGTRRSPITGRIHHHNGIDIAAPRGSEVFVTRDGTVTGLGYDDTYGRYILVSHSEGYETLYGHLDTQLVELNQSVVSGMIIGTVGSTGLSTGPHLHFEIRRKGEARDPYPLMPLF